MVVLMVVAGFGNYSMWRADAVAVPVVGYYALAQLQIEVGIIRNYL